MDDWVEINRNDHHVARERKKASELKKTEWWKTLKAAGICHYCGQKVGAENLTMDHVIPVVRGGSSTKGNIVPACSDCNRDKKTAIPAEQILKELFGENDETELLQ